MMSSTESVCSSPTKQDKREELSHCQVLGTLSSLSCQTTQCDRYSVLRTEIIDKSCDLERRSNEFVHGHTKSYEKREGRKRKSLSPVKDATSAQGTLF